jgi:hypothetical protein
MKTILPLLLATSLGALADAPSDTLKGDNFQITAPVQLTGGSPAPAQAPQVDAVTYHGALGTAMTFSLTYIDYQPGTVAKIGPANLVATLGASLQKAGKYMTANHFPLKTRGQAGAEYDMQAMTGGVIVAERAQIYAVGDRIYEVVVTMQMGKPGFSVSALAAYFNSFKVSGANAAPPVATAPPPPPPSFNNPFVLKGDKFQINAPVLLTGGSPVPAQAPQVDTVTYQGGLAGNVMSLTVAYIDYQPGEVAKIGFNQIISDLGNKIISDTNNSGPYQVAPNARIRSSEGMDTSGQIYTSYTSVGGDSTSYISVGGKSDGKVIDCEARLYVVGDRIYELIASDKPNTKNFNPSENIDEAFFNTFKLAVPDTAPPAVNQPLFTLKGDKFQISAPVQLTGGTPVPSKAPQVDTVTYHGALGDGMTFTVTYIDWRPGYLTKVSGATDILQNLDGYAAMQIAKDAKLGHSLQLKDGIGQVGWDEAYQGTGSDGNQIDFEAHAYWVNDRTYELILTYEPYSKGYDQKNIDSYFNSFKLTGGK